MAFISTSFLKHGAFPLLRPAFCARSVQCFQFFKRHQSWVFFRRCFAQHFLRKHLWSESGHLRTSSDPEDAGSRVPPLTHSGSMSSRKPVLTSSEKASAPNQQVSERTFSRCLSGWKESGAKAVQLRVLSRNRSHSEHSEQGVAPPARKNHNYLYYSMTKNRVAIISQ